MTNDPYKVSRTLKLVAITAAFLVFLTWNLIIHGFILLCGGSPDFCGVAAISVVLTMVVIYLLEKIFV